MNVLTARDDQSTQQLAMDVAELAAPRTVARLIGAREDDPTLGALTLAGGAR